MPRFSVVIPVFNRPEMLRAALQSVIDQTFSDWEVLVVDDGSTSNIVDIVREFSFIDNNISYYRQSNRGGGAARNLGIDLAVGDYIAFLDSDDLFLPQKLARVNEYISANIAEVYFSFTKVDRGNQVFGRKPSRGLMDSERVDEYLFCSREPMQTSTVVVERDTALNVRFDDMLQKGQDLDFAVRLFSGNATFKFIPEVLSIWNDQGSKGRVSHQNNYLALNSWLDSNRDVLSKKAFYGFRANVLSYDFSDKHPFLAIGDIGIGFFKGGVGLKRTFHSLLRAIVPREKYRVLVDYVLKLISFLKSRGS